MVAQAVTSAAQSSLFGSELLAIVAASMMLQLFPRMEYLRNVYRIA